MKTKDMIRRFSKERITGLNHKIETKDKKQKCDKKNNYYNKKIKKHSVFSTIIVTTLLFSILSFLIPTDTNAKLGNKFRYDLKDSTYKTIDENSHELQTGFYVVDKNLTLNKDQLTEGKFHKNALEIADNSNVCIYIKKDCKLSLYGQNYNEESLSCVKKGGSAIYLPKTSKLTIIGEGTIECTGGDGKEQYLNSPAIGLDGKKIDTANKEKKSAKKKEKKDDKSSKKKGKKDSKKSNSKKDKKSDTKSTTKNTNDQSSIDTSNNKTNIENLSNKSNINDSINQSNNTISNIQSNNDSSNKSNIDSRNKSNTDSNIHFNNTDSNIHFNNTDSNIKSSNNDSSNQPNNDSSNQSNNDSSNQSNNDSSNQSNNDSSNQPNNDSINQSNNYVLNQSSSKNSDYEKNILNDISNDISSEESLQDSLAFNTLFIARETKAIFYSGVYYSSSNLIDDYETDIYTQLKFDILDLNEKDDNDIIYDDSELDSYEPTIIYTNSIEEYIEHGAYNMLENIKVTIKNQPNETVTPKNFSFNASIFSNDGYSNLFLIVIFFTLIALITIIVGKSIYK